MIHFILHLQAGDRAQAAAMLHANEWVVQAGGRHRNALAPGDLALIHVGQPRCEFIGRATLASAWRGGASSGTVAGGSAGSELLTDVEQ